jgi:hypothetical protein
MLRVTYFLRRFVQRLGSPFSAMYRHFLPPPGPCPPGLLNLIGPDVAISRRWLRPGSPSLVGIDRLHAVVDILGNLVDCGASRQQSVGPGGSAVIRKRTDERATLIAPHSRHRIFFLLGFQTGTSGIAWFMSSSVSKSELRTCQLVEIWLNPDERCYKHEEKGNVICHG